jgi:hypothetical protein
MKIHQGFPRLPSEQSIVPAWLLTPNHPGCIVRFFDTPALSPSGRYAAFFSLPFEDRTPGSGDEGRVLLVDLEQGPDATKVVATTRGWESQLGAQVNWGEDDETLFFGDCDLQTWQPFTAKLNPLTGDRQRLDGPIYHVSPDGRMIIGTNPRLMRRTQRGYGVVVPDEYARREPGIPQGDGVWLTDAATGRAELLHDLADVVPRFREELLIDDPADWLIFAFHSKFAATNDRIIFTLRYYDRSFQSFEDANSDHEAADIRFAVFTSRTDGSDLHLAVGPRYWKHGGHHINFAPDGQSLTMNLRGRAVGVDPGADMVFTQCGLDGSDMRIIAPDIRGGGHPSMHLRGQHVLTDCYWKESFNDEATGTTPLRWVSLVENNELDVLRVRNAPLNNGLSGPLRIDPHPCWDRSWRYITYTGSSEETRRVYLADMQPLLDA